MIGARGNYYHELGDRPILSGVNRTGKLKKSKKGTVDRDLPNAADNR